ncbi:MAG TPA: hypothetical protein VGC79_29460 [Polyangiaceae bacterium]
METRAFWQLANISDTRLRSELGELLIAGYRTEARIIAQLAELEQRKLHLKDGSESLYHYCTSVLRLSNSEAFHRITAARVARKFPLVFGLLEQRQLHLTAICLLRDYLTAENHQQLLAEACHKTKWQIEELLARRFPRPDIESRIRKLPAPAVRTNAPDQSTIRVAEPTNASTTLQLATQPLLPVPELAPAPVKAGPTAEQTANPHNDAAPTQQAASERDASNTPGRARRAAARANSS